MFCGDCIVTGYMPNLEAGSIDDWIKWGDSLDKLEGLTPEIIIPGHGDVIIGRKNVEKAFANMRLVLDNATGEHQGE